MKLEDLFTPEELLLIDSGEYRPGRKVLDAKLDLWAELVRADEREACAKACDELPWIDFDRLPSNIAFATAIRARKTNAAA